ncbi:hypothetical protein PISMIDRAFT_687762 [Pisolithus microcarpus 441]|uniref:Uncharacterized protein n=1 Tax=Pisolithus microcarpus 441 TaxID=765257 RepID=A0A0C9Z3U7_9AGAM|nr:hypothetical protein BKA83DRAFT_687762 [Pisolithus microcarpus]KIK14713.1 hypothetical protein PISMIDRAFT_687762 [Pisolithus microcarpus 441]
MAPTYRLRSAETLKPMYASMDEMLVGYDIAVCYITSYYCYLAGVVHMLTNL